MKKELDKNQKIILDVRQLYVLSKALHFQITHVKDHLNPELKRIVNDLKAKNSFFIKTIENTFEKNKINSDFKDYEEELAFVLLESLEKIKTIKEL